MESLLAQTGFQTAAIGSASGLLHGVIILKAVISLTIIIGASVVAAKYNKTAAGDTVDKTKIKYTSSLWLGENGGLFGTLVILWLPTLLFYALLTTGLLGGPEAAGIGASIGLMSIYIGLTLCLIIITIVMTALMSKAKTDDRVDKLTYISQIFVGSHSGLLWNLFLLWSPFILMLLIKGPVEQLAPYKTGLLRAAQGLVPSESEAAAALSDVYSPLQQFARE